VAASRYLRVPGALSWCVVADTSDVDRSLRRAWRIRVSQWLALSWLAPPLLTGVSSLVKDLDLARGIFLFSGACGAAGAVGAMVTAVRARKGDARVASVTGIVAFLLVALLSLPWAGLWTFCGIMLHAKW
jgi:hypothetical protein